MFLAWFHGVFDGVTLALALICHLSLSLPPPLSLPVCVCVVCTCGRLLLPAAWQTIGRAAYSDAVDARMLKRQENQRLGERGASKRGV